MINLYDIITLENGNSYTVVKTLSYNNIEFLLLIEVDEQENVLDETLIVQKFHKGDYDYVKTIEDTSILSEVKEMFSNMLLNDSL